MNWSSHTGHSGILYSSPSIKLIAGEVWMLIPPDQTSRHLQLRISNGRGLSRFTGLGAPQLIALCSHPLAAAAAILEQARAVVILMLHMCVSRGGSNRKLEESNRERGWWVDYEIYSTGTCMLNIIDSYAKRDWIGSQDRHWSPQ